jgi:hypothetical protein
MMTGGEEAGVFEGFELERIDVSEAVLRGADLQARRARDQRRPGRLVPRRAEEAPEQLVAVLREFFSARASSS